MGRPAQAARCLGVAGLLAIAAPAQAPVHVLTGTQDAAEYGYSVDTVGDVSGDGICDFVIGERRAVDGDPQNGRCHVISGADGSTLHTLTGNWASLAGTSVAGAGDVDGDGVGDVVLGAPGSILAGTAAGTVWVFSGATGVELLELNGLAAYDQLGWSSDGAGDVNADGYADIIAGAPFADPSGNASGRVLVFSGRDGSILYDFTGDSAGDLLGYSVAGIGDVNLDGFDDVAAGAIHDDDNGSNCGMIRIWSGRDGTRLHTRFGDSAGEGLGNALDAAGDVNGDLVPDVIAGASRDDLIGPLSGSAKVFSGSDAGLIYILTRDPEQDQFGHSVAGAGDVDGDGFADLLVGAPADVTDSFTTGSATLFSGSDGSVLHYFTGTIQDGQFGWSVGPAGDLDQDGFAEVVIGSVTEGLGGVVRTFDLGFTGVPPRARTYGAPCAGDLGRLPRVGIRGESRLGEQFTITLHGAAPLRPGTILLIGEIAVAWDLGVIGLPGCTLGVDPYAVITLPTDADGMASLDIPLGLDPGPLGLPMLFQWVSDDPGAPYALGVATSDSLEAIIGN